MKKKFIFNAILFFLFLLISSFQKQNKKEITLELWATYYYIPTLKHSETGVDLLNKKEKKTGLKLNLCDWCKANIEGTVYIEKEGKIHVLNYSGRSTRIQKDCRDCEKYKNYNSYEKTGKVLWEFSSGFGKGVQNFHLKPFKSIAVDNSLIPYGSVLFIPKAENTIYIDENGKEQIHDGYFFAADTGSKIKGNHIDVFLGNTEINPFSFIKSNEKGTFKAFIILDENIIKALKEMH
ncbi:3D domain-containing protein [Aureivirga marina]|uniref:3D domain-containing protein n=1 Tax=Aureivirga marina TaxID=1182451 RepID=UPI0018C9B59F|nr:3D domain-containing protein [Aureivirga marina]